jgi:ABC-type antimicrobial peptide transport system permease subunit
VQDTSTAPAVAVVNESFVKKFLDGKNPIGRRFGLPGPSSTGNYEIVGVVEDTVYRDLKWKDNAMYFLPMMQRPSIFPVPIERDNSLFAGAMVIETSRPMNDMESLTRRTLAEINPNLTVVKFQTFSEQIAGQFDDQRMLARLTMLFGGLALLLAAIGLYGVTAYTVERRTAEIGIRMALGAERGSVIAMVMRGALVQVGIGLAIGIPVALACVRLVKTELYDITKVDTGVLAGAIATLAAAACVAGMIPARRAASVDPVQALRSE